MNRHWAPAIIAFLATVPAYAQDAAPAEPAAPPAVMQRWPTRDAAPAPAAPNVQPAERAAVPRAESPREAPRPAAPASAAAADDQRRRPPGGDRGGEPRVAVPRPPDSRPGRRPDDRRDPGPRVGPRVYVAPPVTVYNYPRRIYPYGYGGFGLGYFYYDPYTWYTRPYAYDSGGWYGGGAYRPDFFYGRDYDMGEIRFRVTPREAQVIVDGFYAGVVDDFDGFRQSLRLRSGPYHVQLVAPGYAPVDVDIRVNPGQSVTYRGDLRRQP